MTRLGFRKRTRESNGRFLVVRGRFSPTGIGQAEGAPFGCFMRMSSLRLT